MSDSDRSSGNSSSLPHSGTTASHPHSEGGAAIFPTAPAIGHPSMIPKHPQSLYNAQTSDLDLTPHEKKVIAYLRAKTAWSLRYPAEDLPSPQQLLEQEEFKWDLRFREGTTEEEDKFYFQSQEGHPSATHKHPQSPYDVQTSALNQPPHERNATSNLPARGASSRSYPIKVLPSTQQLLEQQDAKWYQRLTDYASEYREKYHRQSLEYLEELYRRSDEWHAKSDEKNKEILKLSVELERLICDTLYGKTEVMKLEENFNAKGALEHMVYYAKLRKKIGTDRPPRIQAGLNELAKAPEFTKVLHDEVASRGLELKAVTSCIASIYNKVLQRARGNDYIITLYKEDYTTNEGAVLAAFLRMQSEWSYGLEWREEANYNYTKYALS